MYDNEIFKTKLKKAAIITPGILPVPAVNGGAVESLITYIIEGNEDNPQFEFTVFTCPCTKLDQLNYKYTKIIQVSNDGIRRVLSLGLHGLVKYLHIGKEISAYCLFLKRVDWKKYDVIFVENSMICYETLFHARGTAGKMVYHMHNDIEGVNGDKSPERTEIVARTAERILVVSEYLKRRILEIKETDSIRVLYNCIGLDASNLDESQLSETKKQLGYKENDFYVLYAGRIDPSKGLLELCLAMKKLWKEYENIKLIVVGCCWFPNIMKSDYMDEINDVIGPFSDRVVFTGFVENSMMPFYYKMADLIVVPTFGVSEAFGLVGVEAQAFGKPLIVANSGGMIETVREEFAVVIDKGEKAVEHLTNHIERLYLNPDELRVMGNAAQLHYENEQRFHRENYFNNFVKALI